MTSNILRSLFAHPSLIVRLKGFMKLADFEITSLPTCPKRNIKTKLRINSSRAAGININVRGYYDSKGCVYLFERLTTIYNIEKFIMAIKNIGILL